MAIDITTISVEMDTSSLRAGQTQLDRTAAAGANLARSFVGVAAAFGAGLGITELARKLVDTERVTGSLMASLEVATGSAKNAENAFASLASLSSQLPESLNDVTKAFTMMVNLGLDPSQAAIKSYSNTASAMNKSLMQMVEAVADATTGQYERLKEFGIKASAQGDKVAFTFRGTTTTVKNSADEITRYLKQIGENDFAGMAEKKMATLDGAISNLGDSWDGLFRTINKQGSGTAMAEVVREITKAIQDLDAAIASSQLEGYIDSIKTQFRGFDEDIKRSSKIISDLFGDIGKTVGITKEDVVSAFTEMPQNIRAFIQIVIVELLSLSEKALAVGNLMRDALNPMKFYNGEALGNFRKELDRINGVRDDSIAGILKEKDATTEAAKEQRKYADFARAMYDWNAENSAKSLEDLGKYKVEAAKVTALTKEQQKALEKAAEKEADRAENIADLVASMTREADLMGEQSKEAQVRYDIEKKLLDVKGGINGTEAESLINAAKSIDLKKKEIDQAENLNKKILADIESQTSAAVDAVGEWSKESEKAAQSISDSLTDALMRGFESGKGFAETLKDTVVNMFKTMVLKPLIQPIMDKAAGAISGMIGSSGTKGADGKTTGGSGALGAIGAAAPYVAIAVAVGGALIGKWNERMEKGMLELTSEYRQSTQSTGTLLGNANAKSDSINKALSQMGDSGASLLDVNHGMYQALLDIKTGIGGSAAGFARQGIGGINAASGVATGVTDSGEKGKWAAAALVGGVFGLAVKGIADFIGGSFGGFVNSVLGGISKAIYNKKVSITDTGIQIIGDSLSDMMERGSLDAVNYAEVKTTKKFLGVKTSVKSRTETTDMDEVFKMQFAQVFEGAGKALEEASKAFGVDFDASKLMIDATKLSLKGLEGDALTKEIESFFSATLDKWAGSLVEGLTQFQQVGEGAFETMIRLASQTNIFTSYAEKLLPKFNMVGFSAVEVTQAIAELSGGFDRLQTNMASYYQNFFSDTEKTEKGLSQIGEVLASVGLTMPKTRDEFRALVESLDITSEAQQKQYAALLDVNQAFAQFVPAAKAADDATKELADSFDKIAEQQKNLSEKLFDLTATDAEKRQRLLDEALSSENRAIQQQIFDYQDAQEAMKAAADAANLAAQAQEDAANEQLRIAEDLAAKMSAIANERYGLETELLQLQGDTVALRERELLTLDESNRSLKEQIFALEDSIRAQEIESKAKEDAAKLAEDAANAQLKIAEDLAAKVREIAQERYSIETELLQLQGDTNALRERELLTLDESNRALKEQIFALEDAKKAQDEAAKAQEEALEDARRAAEEQIRLAQGVHDSISSALKSLLGQSDTFKSMSQSQARMTLQGALMTAKSGGSIVGYAGLEDALSAIQQEGTYGSAEESRLAIGRNVGLLSELAKYTNLNGSHANGLDYVPFDSYVAQLHKGERVQTAGEAKSNGDLAAKVDRLIEVVNAGNIAIAQNTAKSAKIAEKWDNDGSPETRSVA